MKYDTYDFTIIEFTILIIIQVSLFATYFTVLSTTVTFAVLPPEDCNK